MKAKTLISLWFLATFLTIFSIVIFPSQWDPVFFALDSNYKYNRDSRDVRLETTKMMSEGIKSMRESGLNVESEEVILRESIRRMRETTSANYIDYLISRFIFKKNLEYPTFE